MTIEISTRREVALSKMNEIVANGRSAAERGIQALATEWNLRQDFIVRPTAIEPIVTEVAEGQFHLTMGFEGRSFNLTNHARGQLFERSGVPGRFADNLLGWGQGDLLVENMKRLLPVVSGEAILVREVGGTVKANLSASYKRMDASPIFEAFTKAALAFGLVPFKGEVSDTRAYLAFVRPAVVEIAPGEHVVFGVELRTSDYGNGAVEINQVVLRLLCTNGMIGSDLLRQIHLGRRFDPTAFAGQSTIKLSQRTVELDTAALRSAVGDVVKALPEHMRGLESILRARTTESVNLPAAIAALTKRGLGKEVTAKVKDLYEEASLPVEAVPEAPGAWRLSNVLSMLAKSETDADAAHELSAAAFAVMIPESKRAVRAAA